MPTSEENPGAREILVALGVFGAGFFVVAGAIHAAIPSPLRLHADIRSEKLAVLDGMQGKAESAAFGSSHVHEGFNPGVFDRELAGSLLQTRSENLAVGGGIQAEQRVMALEYARHLQPPPDGTRACFVILELSIRANFTNGRLVHPRAINIYDWRSARFISRLVEPSMSFEQRAGRTGYALLAMGLHYINVGMLSNLIFAPPLDQAMLTNETESDRRGQEVHFYNAAAAAAVSKRIAADPKQTKVEPFPMPPGNSEVIAEIEDASPVKGLAFAYVAMPKLDDLTLSYEYPDHIEAGGLQVPIVNLARPDRYPQLYRAELWQDGGHLNDRGAEIVTRLIADELKQWYAAHGGAPRCGG